MGRSRHVEYPARPRVLTHEATAEIVASNSCELLGTQTVQEVTSHLNFAR